MLIMRQALGQGPMPRDIGALDAKDKSKGKDKGKGKGKPDIKMTCDYCRWVDHRKVRATPSSLHWTMGV